MLNIKEVNNFTGEEEIKGCEEEIAGELIINNDLEIVEINGNGDVYDGWVKIKLSNGDIFKYEYRGSNKEPYSKIYLNGEMIIKEEIISFDEVVDKIRELVDKYNVSDKKIKVGKRLLNKNIKPTPNKINDVIKKLFYNSNIDNEIDKLLR
jgi:hypothetical protein